MDAVRPEDEAARRGDWQTYFAALPKRHGVRQEVRQPPAERTNREPWPEDFVAPAATVALRTLAELAGWEVRLGYSRAYVKKGQGSVWADGSTSARWVLCHIVQVAVRRPGGTGRAEAWVMHHGPVGGKGWTYLDGQVGTSVVTLTDWKSFVECGPREREGS